MNPGTNPDKPWRNGRPDGAGTAGKPGRKTAVVDPTSLKPILLSPPSRGATQTLSRFQALLGEDREPFLTDYRAMSNERRWLLPVGAEFAWLLAIAARARCEVEIAPVCYAGRVIPMPLVALLTSYVNAWHHQLHAKAPRPTLLEVLWGYTLMDMGMLLEDMRGEIGVGLGARLRHDLPFLVPGGAED